MKNLQEVLLLSIDSFSPRSRIDPSELFISLSFFQKSINFRKTFFKIESKIYILVLLILVCSIEIVSNFAEVEQLLEPEERAILQQNDKPNLHMISTVSFQVFLSSISLVCILVCIEQPFSDQCMIVCFECRGLDSHGLYSIV